MCYARQPIDHFTVVCLVAWPLNEIETGVDLASQLFSCGIIIVSKKGDTSIKRRSTPASLSFKDQATKHTTVKIMVYSFLFNTPWKILTGEQGWCSGESTPLPPMWTGFDSELGTYVG